MKPVIISENSGIPDVKLVASLNTCRGTQKSVRVRNALPNSPTPRMLTSSGGFDQIVPASEERDCGKGGKI